MNTLELSNAIMFNPVDAFYYIKSRQNPINYLSCIFLLLMVIAVRIAAIFITHFPIASIQPRDASILLETVKYLLPILTWVISCYAITSISDGETMLGEIFAAAAYSVVPYIVCTIPLALLSRVIGRNQLLLYNVLNTIVLIWVLTTFFISVKTLNDYTLGKTLKVCIISLITMLLIWGVLILLFALSSQLIQFIWDIILEMKMIFIK